MEERMRKRRAKAFVGVGAASLGALLILAVLEATYVGSRRRLDEDAATYDDFADDLSSKEDPLETVDDDDLSGVSFSSFIVGFLSALSIKLTSSVDDVVWLVPYLIVPEKSRMLTNTAIYMWVCMVQTVLALSISHGGMATLNAVNGGKGWSSEKILTLFAGICLLGYGCKLAYEYYREVWLGEGDDDDDEEEGGSGSGGSEATGLMDEDKSGYSAGGVEKGAQSAGGGGGGGGGGKANAKARTSSSLFVVAFLGSLDDLTLFVPMLLGQAISWVELVVGAFVAAALIVILCICLGQCRPVAKFLESIPLAAIVLVFGIYLSIKAALMS